MDINYSNNRLKKEYHKKTGLYQRKSEMGNPPHDHSPATPPRDSLQAFLLVGLHKIFKTYLALLLVLTAKVLNFRAKIVD